MALGSLASDDILVAVVVNYRLGDLRLFLCARGARKLQDGYLFGTSRLTY